MMFQDQDDADAPVEAEAMVENAMKELQRFQAKPLSKADKVLVMQGWNKCLAFKTAFSEALIIYWRLLCCDAGGSEESSGNVGGDDTTKQTASAMKLVENNKDPLANCLRDRLVDAEELLMGLLDGAIRSLCPATQIVQREAYRPMEDRVTLARAKNDFTLECGCLKDYIELFTRLGVTPQYWIHFVHAVCWTMKTHAPVELLFLFSFCHDTVFIFPLTL